MADLLTTLESFNRKERFFLVAQALNDERPASFKLSGAFRQELGKAVGLTEQGIAIPADAFAAMDYHLNWVHAALVLSHHTDESERRSRLDIEGATESNQRDIDLLVAFKDTAGIYHLIFVEAKGYNTDGMSDGLSSFDGGTERGQLVTKAGRLKVILEPNGIPYTDIKPYFCLMTGKDTGNRPDPWVNWLKLSLPRERLVVKHDGSILRSGPDWLRKQGRQVVSTQSRV